jgi:NAD(P)H-hydrate repair Nnr-like enzyme with NAD(P)H-hydrate epimerase domain
VEGEAAGCEVEQVDVVSGRCGRGAAHDEEEVLWTCGRGYDGGDAVGGGQQVEGGGARRQVHEVEGVAVTALSDYSHTAPQLLIRTVFVGIRD